MIDVAFCLHQFFLRLLAYYYDYTRNRVHVTNARKSKCFDSVTYLITKLLN